MKYYYWLLKQSLSLDVDLFNSKIWGLPKLIQFFYIKYSLIIKHLFKRFDLGKDNVRLFGRTIYYDSCYGLAGYQRQLVSNAKFMHLAGIKKPKIVIDVGANVGYFSLMIKNFYPKSRIYCFEPIPHTYSCLYKNFNQDKLVKTYNSAIGNKIGKAKMSFDKDNNALSQIKESGNVSVSTTTLDEITKINNVSSIDILKIDTEGYESFVLEGAKKTLAMTKYLLIEVSLTKDIKYSLSYLMSLLYSKDFEFQLIYFRNFDNSAEGATHNFDYLMKNKKLS